MSFDPPLIWFLIGLGLILLEFALPGAIIVFFGVGAWVTALTTWMGITGSLAWQILVFSGSSVLLLLLLRRRLKGQFLGHSGGIQDLDRDLEEFIGRIVQVTSPIRPGADGTIEFKGAQWEACSESSFDPADRARIVGLEGIRVTVAPVNAPGVEDQEVRP